MHDVIVIGAGMGGLSAAVSLAARGRKVLVVEALTRPGGKANVVEVDGVELDTGPSLFTLRGVLDDLLREAGTCLEDEVALFEHEPSFRYVYPDGATLDLPASLDGTLAAVGATLGARAAEELGDFVAYARKIWEAAAPHFVFGPAPSVRGVASLGIPGWLAIGQIDALRSMQSAIEARVKTPKLRDLLLRYATYNGSDPRRAPATLNCIVWAELGLGRHGVEGGMHAVVRALHRVAERHGAVVRCGAPVRRVLVEGGRAAGVELQGGERLQARAVVANADVAHVFADLAEGAGKPPKDEPSTSGWTAIVRARRRTGAARRAAHTVLFPRDYLNEFRDLFDLRRPPEEPTVYLCAQEHAHRRRGWAEHEPVFVMANAPAEPVERETEPAVWSALRGRVLGRLRAAGLLDPDDEIVWERTPTELGRTFARTRGALYGAASNGTFSAFRRPSNRVRSPRGLYLASGSAHPGGGVPLCLQSGRAAAQALMDDEA